MSICLLKRYISVLQHYSFSFWKYILRRYQGADPWLIENYRDLTERLFLRFQENVKQCSKDKYHIDIGFQERVKQSAKHKYHSDEEYDFEEEERLQK